jgi:hypothetical protein
LVPHTRERREIWGFEDSRSAVLNRYTGRRKTQWAEKDYVSFERKVFTVIRSRKMFLRKNLMCMSGTIKTYYKSLVGNVRKEEPN